VDFYRHRINCILGTGCVLILRLHITQCTLSPFWKIRKANQPKEIKNGASATLPKLSSTSYDLWPPDLNLIISCPFPVDHLYHLASKSVHLFSKYRGNRFSNIRTNKWMVWNSRVQCPTRHNIYHFGDKFMGQMN